MAGFVRETPALPAALTKDRVGRREGFDFAIFDPAIFGFWVDMDIPAAVLTPDPVPPAVFA